MAAFRGAVALLFASIVAGVIHSLVEHHRLPTLQENGLAPLDELMEGAEPAEVIRELCTATRFLASPGMTRRLLELADRAQDLDSRIYGTRRMIGIGAAWDARTFNRLAAMLLKRAHAIEWLVGPSAPDPDGNSVREARRWAARAARLEPDNAESRLHQGIASACLGESDEAVANLKEALRLDPELRIAGQVLKLLTSNAGNG